MKKKIICFISILISLTFLVAFASESILTTKEMNLETKEISESFCDDPVFELLKEKYQDENERQKAMLAYGKKKALNSFSHKENEYFYKCVSNNIDIFNLMDAYDFWKETNQDINIIENICKNYDSEDRNWVKNAYNKITNNSNGTLKKEEREKYFNKGITAEQMSFAEKISLKGDNTVKEILEKILNGKSRVSLLKDVHNDKISFFSDIMLSMNNLEDKDWIKFENAIYLNKLTGENLLKLLKYDDLEEKISEYENQVADKVRLELINNGYVDENYGKRDGQIKFENKVYDMTLNLGVSAEEISELKRQGYDIVTIYNMKLQEAK